MQLTPLRNHTIVALSILVSTTAVHAGQVRRQAAQPESVPVTVTLKFGDESYASTAPGSCTHAPKASIYNVLSENWMVMQEAGGRSVQLTLWRPADGTSEMVSLAVNGRKNLQVSTVRGGAVSGSGTVKLQPSGKGGTFTIDLKAKSGEAITGTIQCAAFTPSRAEAG